MVSLSAIPLFGVMTKVDQVAKNGKEGEVSEALFEKRKKLFIDSLGLKGTTRYIFACNYCNDTDGEQKRLRTVIPEIDAPLLQFMVQVCDPVTRVSNTGVTFNQSQTNVRRRRRLQEAEQNKHKKLIEVVTRISGSDLCPKIVLAVIVIMFIYAIFFILIFPFSDPSI